MSASRCDLPFAYLRSEPTQDQSGTGGLRIQTVSRPTRRRSILTLLPGSSPSSLQREAGKVACRLLVNVTSCMASAYRALPRNVSSKAHPAVVDAPAVSCNGVRHPAERDGSMSDVLEGIRVLDFGRYIAGPFCAALLADLGADVIRIERRGGGEDRWVAPVGDDGVGAMYLAMNRNKRGMTLDPSRPEGREVVRRLVATADVVVANLPPEVLRSLALDLESLRRVKPDIILTTVTAFGAGGPWSHKHGFDGIGQVMCGSAYLTGTPEQPLRAAVAWVDFGTASVAALGTLAALMERGKTGRGQKVEAALLRTAVAFNIPTLVEQAVIETDRVATLNRGQTSAPSDLFRTRDGWIIAYAIGGPMFRRWATLMGEPEWLTDPRFADDRARGDHGEIISARMSRWTAERTTGEALAELEKVQIPAGPLYSPRQALEDEHIRATGLLHDTEYPGLPRPAPLAPTPVDLSETPGRFRHRAPTLGEHTDAVLAELGYGRDEIRALRESGVV
jgi:crotonobetainyl-CoA:carnitine CoA-transferase CaiB-like acyl-CoA transferase